jgi:CRP-like cAMP-binding protein
VAHGENIVSLTNELRASIAAEMLMPKEEGHPREAVQRVASYLLELRARAEAEALRAQLDNDARAHD